ncbi:1-aminocyclopropane-1-carboxylate deaminase/D-cysteine desulfhydrase [Reichenbachiella versicolor]|uniref:1-aminocyclopropane-1-carboxylate deaminase/D-cysteine desulfhydrase n=1 Tax=Reichenbachiella versicolor TaxID=1821036 RepID=UPI000D6E8F52|nr:pyridoxal-phosphate dependent enzyme [Reichenbachiella versicolor]
MFEQFQATPIVEIKDDLLDSKDIQLWIKRDDIIHPEISGNKWRKLKYNLIDAQKEGYQNILTFGGAYSNHIAATAAACKRYGFKSIGIIRGDELSESSNQTLSKAHNNGMELRFVTRSGYRKRIDNLWLRELASEFQAFIIPEGGSNVSATKGVAELVTEIEIDFDYICSAVGTGGTIAGISNELKPYQTALGFAALKGEDYLKKEIAFLTSSKQWKLINNYHFGGYAKLDNQLIHFIQNFYTKHQVPLDHIYTGKMLFGLFNMIQKDQFPKGTRIIAVHTGGLQGSNFYKQA